MSVGTQHVMRLPGVLDLAAADNFLGAVRQQLEQGRTLCLDASDVETLTLPCVQIILAADATHEVAILNPSAPFLDAFRDLAINWTPRVVSDGVLESVAMPTASTEPEEPVAAMSAASASLDPAPDAPAMLDPVASMEAAAEPTIAESTIEATIEPAVAPAPIASEPGAPQPSNDENLMDETAMTKRILTIDDSKTIRDMLMFTLSDAGFDVLQAVDGQHGLDVLGDKRVDVVITDINMPKMDGYEVIRNLRRNPVHKTTPILVLTTESDSEKKGMARDAGATGWMVKPFDPERLIATIRKVAP
jgi:two-component system chemotaxis response regulator CheY